MIEIRLFGETRVVDGTRTVGPREFGGIKPRQVLEVLALNAGHHVTKDRLVDCLWGEHPPASAIPTLEAYVSLLRRRLDPAAPVATSALRTTNGGYALDTDRVRVDHLDFQRLLSGALLEPAPIARQRLQQGLDLAHADLLESEPYVAWAIRARADVHADIVSACEAAGLRALAGGDWADAASLVRRAILLDRWPRRAHGS